MKNLIYIFLFVLPLQGVAQKFADKEYYLVDSLVLEDLSVIDRKLIENCLKNYHTAINDTSKIKELTHLCEYMMHKDRSKYQFYQHDLIKNLLSQKQDPQVKDFLLGVQVNALSNIGRIYWIRGDIPNSIDYYHKSFKIFEQIENKVLAIEQEEKEKQQILIGAIAGGLGLFVVFLVFIFNRLRNKK